MFDPGRPLFQQIAESIEDSIVDGSLAEEEKAPSTNELAAFHRINPATAAKGVAALTDRGILYKKRGIGMFVATGAREVLLAERRERFAQAYIVPMLAEARRLGLGPADVEGLVRSAGSADAAADTAADDVPADHRPQTATRTQTTRHPQEDAP
ncbi:GntR family transcriptional regulator [Brevibacterium salitolerans]|uniref:HTH gntR-type domain-containing protein n=2 Tax=Brevibacterium TaxID=1696 RepID=A0ABN2X522_9MICO